MPPLALASTGKASGYWMLDPPWPCSAARGPRTPRKAARRGPKARASNRVAARRAEGRPQGNSRPARTRRPG
eukprot:4316584-Alexandrium_andersonii.AAC.1